MRKAIVYIVGLGLLAVCALELTARLITPDRPWLSPRYVEISRDFDELDALIADAGWRPGVPPVYYDEFLYGPRPVETDHVTFTDYFSARLTPDSAPLSEAEHIVWAFGGSTMENTETTDSLTIANTWARAFNQALGSAHVKNFGAGGFFSSYQVIKFQRLLREVPDEERPHVAVFYDGYNDAVNGLQYGAGRLQGDLSHKVESLVESKSLALWAYATSSALQRVSVLWHRTGAQAVQRTFFPFGAPDPGPENLDATVSIYLSNVKMLGATCDAFEVRCFFVLQPLLLTKEPLAPNEREALEQLEAHPRFGPEGTRFVREFYRRAAEALGDQDAFIDASGILNGRIEDDFYDPGHVGALTPPVIGERLAAILLERLAADPGSGMAAIRP